MPRDTIPVRLYFATEYWETRFVNGLNALHQGLWLGLLSQSSLNRVTRRYYISQNDYQDDDYNNIGLSSWESRMLDRFFGTCNTILVGAAGGGREAVALSQRGVRCDAFDCNATLVEHCRALLNTQGVTANVVAAAPGKVPQELGTYDGGIIGWGAYMHIPGRQNRIRFLQQFRSHLASGGPLLLSFFTRGTDSASFRCIHSVARTIRWLRRADQAVEMGDRISGSFDHFFTREEIQSELEEAGFELLHYSPIPYGHAVGRTLIP